MSKKHPTPRPWRIASRGSLSYIVAATGENIASCSWMHGQQPVPAMENAVHIIQCVNSHDTLFAFAATIARMTQDGEEFVMENEDAVTTLNALIDEARLLVAEAKGLAA